MLVKFTVAFHLQSTYTINTNKQSLDLIPSHFNCTSNHHQVFPSKSFIN